MSRWPIQTEVEFFAARADNPNDGGCWEWSGARFPTGYGQARKKEYAHRLAWRLFNGPIPLGGQVLHKCDNPPCVNPSHLYVGNDADNRRDARERRRFSGGGKGPSKLNSSQVIEIKKLREGQFSHLSQEKASAEIASRYGVSRFTVRSILTGKNWTTFERKST